MKAKSAIISLLIVVIILAAGIVNLVLGITRLNKLGSGRYKEVEATITNIETFIEHDSENDIDNERYEITVEYTVDGKKYVSQLGETPKEFHEGMQLTVLYDTEDPTDVVLPGKTGAYIMIGIGIVAILVSIIMFLKKLFGR